MFYDEKNLGITTMAEKKKKKRNNRRKNVVREAVDSHAKLLVKAGEGEDIPTIVVRGGGGRSTHKLMKNSTKMPVWLITSFFIALLWKRQLTGCWGTD